MGFVHRLVFGSDRSHVVSQSIQNTYPGDNVTLYHSTQNDGQHAIVVQSDSGWGDQQDAAVERMESSGNCWNWFLFSRPC